ncbi:hypothetical protein [Rhodopseudomonas sp. RCAM05734]|uniref:hypothetical protein n=1 Tax=Rhodopseudomonas sp. RCAM05734 TaxID=3457549 RepID=UPI004044E74F
MMPTTILPILPICSDLRLRRLAQAFIVLLALSPSPSTAREAPSAPFLQKNGFYLESAGFKARFVSDAASQEAMRKLPAHRFVVHKTPNGPVYVYADPKACVCIFTGRRDNYLSYLDILRAPLPQADAVSPDYKSEAGALLADDPVDSAGIDWQPDSAAAFLRDYY